MPRFQRGDPRPIRGRRTISTLTSSSGKDSGFSVHGRGFDFRREHFQRLASVVASTARFHRTNPGSSPGRGIQYRDGKIVASLMDRESIDAGSTPARPTNPFPRSSAVKNDRP